MEDLVCKQAKSSFAPSSLPLEDIKTFWTGIGHEDRQALLTFDLDELHKRAVKLTRLQVDQAKGAYYSFAVRLMSWRYTCCQHCANAISLLLVFELAIQEAWVSPPLCVGMASVIHATAILQQHQQTCAAAHCLCISSIGFSLALTPHKEVHLIKAQLSLYKCFVEEFAASQAGAAERNRAGAGPQCACGSHCKVGIELRQLQATLLEQFAAAIKQMKQHGSWKSWRFSEETPRFTSAQAFRCGAVGRQTLLSSPCAVGQLAAFAVSSCLICITSAESSSCVSVQLREQLCWLQRIYGGGTDTTRIAPSATKG